MSGSPTAEQFYALAGAFDRYRKSFCDGWRDACNQDEPLIADEREISALAKRAEEISEQSFDSSYDDQSDYALEWLGNRPEFAIAIRAIGFRPRIEAYGEDGDAGRFGRIIGRCVEQKRSGRSIGYRLSATSGRYLEYVSGVSRAAANFMSGRSTKAALEGSATFERMRELVGEFYQLLEVDWFSEYVSSALYNNLERLSGSIEKCMPPPPISKRNDADLPARLMASELIHLNQRMFSATHKRAVFHLMGLPIVDRPIEMRTVERLAKALKERRRDN